MKPIPCEPRRAAVILIQRGDPEIAGAIARGMLEARGRPTTADAVPFPADAGRHSFPVATGKYPRSGGWGTPAADAERQEAAGRVEIVSAEADRSHIVAQLVRVAVGNTRTPEDYRHMIIRARGMYGETHTEGPLRAFTGRLLVGWAMLCEGIRRAYRAQDRILRRS